jgi:hypothetical protein
MSPRSAKDGSISVGPPWSRKLQPGRFVKYRERGNPLEEHG